MKEEVKLFIFLIFLSCLIFPTRLFASGATLSMVPQSGEYSVGKKFSVNIYASSPDEAMNAVSGLLNFSQDKIEVVSISKAGSIITFWLKDPSFSNSIGTIRFEGVALNPGYTGNNGRILTINFKAKAQGTAELRFSSGSILANDGNGTSILKGMNSSKFTIQENSTEENNNKDVVVGNGLPPTPIIFSSTNEKQDKWYDSSEVKLEWLLPDGLTGLSYSIDNIPDTISGNKNIGLKKEFIDRFSDGEWYFHLHFKNNNGWGETGHFKFLIDTVSPKNFVGQVLGEKETENPTPEIYLDSSDELSGLDYYKIIINNGEAINVPLSLLNHGIFTLPAQEPGKKVIVMEAHDKAGNIASAVDEVVIKPLPIPEVSEYKNEINENEAIVIKGAGGKDVLVNAVLKNTENENEEKYLLKTDKDGNFVFVRNKMKSGIYVVSFQAINDKGAKSEVSKSITVNVNKPLVIAILSRTLSIFAYAAPIIYIIFLVSLFSLYFYRHYLRLKKRIKKEANEAEEILHKSFSQLRAEFYKQIKYLESIKDDRPLTREEKKILRDLKGRLKEAEAVIAKEIIDIEREVR